MAKYQVLKPFGNFRKGQTIDDNKHHNIVHRKLQEGETLKKIEEKMKEKHENKMMPKHENKGGK